MEIIWLKFFFREINEKEKEADNENNNENERVFPSLIIKDKGSEVQFVTQPTIFEEHKFKIKKVIFLL